ncbi:hypothetical protein NLJ89_g1618 [Agrocybe chaxingu]|uniref:Protein kinase domain-containing protein n=1 Tax=Agrocybe chaxingu TaxID=84603 RepID=A0A9W8TE28_9AGAR|nr:hypothetical protein NLJ89_g1618 [Agrocybe chaxingu]
MSSQPLFGTGETPTTTLLEHLQEFFSWRLRPIQQATAHTASTSTRKPKWYDLHLSPDLRLSNIVVVPGLAKKLSEVLDDNLAMNKEVFFLPLDGFPDEQERDRQAPHAAVDERSLEVAYRDQTGAFCSLVASVFAFKLQSWLPVFRWATYPAVPQSCGKADGFMVVQDSDVLSDADRADVEMMNEQKLYHPVIWEFKSLTAGSLEVMHAITDLEGSFSWTSCDPGKHYKDCGNKQQHTFTGRPTGPDAPVTEELINRFVSTTSDTSMPSPAQSNPPSGEQILSSSSTARVAPQPVDKGKRRAQEEVRKSARHKKGKSSTGQLKERFKLPTSSKRPTKKAILEIRQKAMHIVQQGWTEAVLNDASFIVFSSGNLEIFGVRQRATRTLYLSAVIQPPVDTNPAHGKLHTALMLAGYQDAIARARLLREISHQPVAEQPILFKQPFMSGSNVKAKKNVATRKATEQVNKALVASLLSMVQLSIRLPAELTQAPYIRSCILLGNMPSDSRTVDPPCSSAIEISLQRSFTERTWEVSLSRPHSVSTELPDVYSDQLVMKIAGLGELTKLQREISTYHELHAIPEIRPYLVNYIGLFDCSSDTEKLFGILMEGRGDTFDTLRKHRRPLKRFTEHRQEFKSALEALHSHGYIHGAISRKHLLMDSEGRTTFISLSTCAKETPETDTNVAGPSTPGNFTVRFAENVTRAAEMEALENWLSAI